MLPIQTATIKEARVKYKISLMLRDIIIIIKNVFLLLNKLKSIIAS